MASIASSRNEIPNINVTSLSQDSISFTVTGSQEMANALRRIMISDVPTIAIDLVSIEENSSPLVDELIAHRLGLIPIDSRRADEYKDQRECSCNSTCSECTVNYSIDVSCSSSGSVDVTHFDIQPTMEIGDAKTDWFRSQGSDLGTPLPVPLWDSNKTSEENRSRGIPITRLGAYQQLRCTMSTRKGVGKMHAKYNPTGTVVMRYPPLIKINRDIEKKLSSKQKREVVESCPDHLFELDHNGLFQIRKQDVLKFTTEAVEKCSLLGAKGAISITHDLRIAHFTVETTGSRPPEDIVRAALKVLAGKIGTLIEDLGDWEREMAMGDLEAME